MKKQIRRRRSQGFTLVELMIVVAIIGVLAVLAVFGVRKYIASAKTAEARNSLGRIGKDAVAAYEREHVAGGTIAEGSPTAITHRVCGNSTQPVPVAIADVAGKKYQSQKLDWNSAADLANHAGFPCLRFEMTAPQYYQYAYTGNNTGPGAGDMTATATGDLNGDGITSLFTMNGTVEGGRFRLALALTEANPDE